MRIDRIETIPLRVPLRPELAIRASGGTHCESPFLLVRIHTGEGLCGLGEVSCTPRWSGEDQVTAAHVVATYFAPLLAGRDPLDRERIMYTVRRAIAGHAFTKAAVEMALWDLAGKYWNTPVYRLLGGPVRDAVPVKWSVSGVKPAEAARIAEWALQYGFGSMKVKVGIDAREDFERAGAVRAVLGGEARLGVDANGAWQAGEAVANIERLAAHGIAFAEQPVGARDIQGMAEVRRRVTVPVIADESVYTAQDAFALAHAGAADVFSIYIGKAGGIAGAMEVAAVAQAANLACTVGSNLELGVGTAAMLHFATACNALQPERYACDIIGPLYYLDDIVEAPFEIRGGLARAADRPGLGVTVSEEKLRQYRA